MSDQGPTVFNDRYEMHRRLARGGMSDVYLARDLLLDRPVAVKVLFPEYAKDPTFVERFRREAQAAANLNHPNIVAVYDWGQQGGTYFIVMEYIEGRSLSEIMRTEGPLHPRRAAEITADVAAALGFAHRNGVVHRDIKPGNILISPSGQVKVADFGIAQAVAGGHRVQPHPGRRGHGHRHLLLARAGPGQGRSTPAATSTRSAACSTRCSPPGRRSPATRRWPSPTSTCRSRRRCPAPPASPCPPALEAIVAQLMAKDPAQRYASAEDLRADLRNYLEGLPVSALRSAAALAAGSGRRRRRRRRGRGGAGRHPGRRPGAVRPARPPATVHGGQHPPAKKRSATFLWVLLGVLVVLAAGLLFLATRLDRSSDPAEAGAGRDRQAGRRGHAPALEADGFKVTVGPRPTAVPNGQVFAQSPVGGAQADQGSTVTLDVSKGAGQVDVPSVVGPDPGGGHLAAGRGRVHGAGHPQNSDTVPVGQVISQSPQRQHQADKGAEVDITVSSGPATVKVPDVTGQSAASASANLASAGFKVTTVNQSSTTVPAGEVIGTNPAAGIPVAPGTTVTIIVSTGAPADLVDPPRPPRPRWPRPPRPDRRGPGRTRRCGR